MKKIFAIVTSLAIAGLIIAPAPAQADAISDLQATIDALQAQLNDALAQLVALGGGVGGVGVSCTFTRALSPGSTGADVQCLQRYLNDAGNTVAASGVGSAGNETQYYGSLTTAAVGAWQDANGVAYGAYRGYFGPVSQAKYNALSAGGTPGDPVTPPSGGAEGNLTVTLESTPSSGTDVNEGETLTVVSYKVKATESSLILQRVDLKFNARAWLYLDSVAIYADGSLVKEIAATEANFTEVTVSSNYSLRFGNLSVNIPEDGQVIISVKVTVIASLPSASDKDAIGITALANAFRAIDESGLNQYSSVLSAKTFDAKVLNTGTLEITANADNPTARPVMINETAQTTGVVLLRVNIKAKNNDVIIRTIRVNAANGSTTGPIDTLWLYEGDTLLSSTGSITSATSTFAEVDLTIPKDTTKTLTVKGTILKAQGNFVTTGAAVASSTMTIEPNTNGITAEDASDFTTVTSGNISGSTVTSGKAYYYVKAPSLALNSASITQLVVSTGTQVYYGKLQARIKIDVTAKGGDIFFPTYAFSAGTAASSAFVAATNTVAASTTITYTYDSNANSDTTNVYVVRGNETKWFEVTAIILNGSGGTDALMYGLINRINWNTTATSATQSPNAWTWGLNDFKTTSAQIEAFR